jgi:hypothetical protein
MDARRASFTTGRSATASTSSAPISANRRPSPSTRNRREPIRQVSNASRSLTATRTSSGRATEIVAPLIAGICARRCSRPPAWMVKTLVSSGMASASRMRSSLVQVAPVIVVRRAVNASDEARP